MTSNQARKRLQAIIKRLGGQKFVAKLIGCSVPMLSRVLSGQKSFGPKFANKIKKKFKIPAKVWELKRRTPSRKLVRALKRSK